MRHPLLVPDLRELVLEREEKALRDFFVPHHPAATAELLDDLAPEEALYVLTLLSGACGPKYSPISKPSCRMASRN